MGGLEHDFRGTGPDAAATRWHYAFKDSSSDGATTLQTLSFNTNGTMWDGWGAGPLTGAFGFELSQNTVDNKGTRGSLYLRSDLVHLAGFLRRQDARPTEGYAEFNMPLISGVPGVNLWSLNVGGSLHLVLQQGRRRHHRCFGHAGHLQLEGLQRCSSPSTSSASV